MRKMIQLYKDAFSGIPEGVWWLSLIMLINRSGTMIAPFMSLYMTKALGYSLIDAGWVMGAYGVGSILGAYVGGQLTDRFGHYYVQFYSLIVSACFVFLLMFFTNYYLIFFTVFCFAAVADMVRPANSVAVAIYAPSDNRTRSYSLMRFAVNLGFSIGPAVGGLVAGWFGFKWIFLIDALTCLGAAVILHLYLPKRTNTNDVSHTSNEVKGLSAYRDRTYLIFIGLVALYGTAFFQLFTSVPVYWGKEWMFSEVTIGFLLAFNGLLIVLIEMPLILSIENVDRPKRIIALGCILLALGFLSLMTGWQSIVMACSFILFMSFSEIFAMPFMTNYAISKATPSREGQYMALYSMAYGIAHIVAPMGSMWLAQKFGFNFLYTALIVLSLLIGGLFLRIKK